MAGADLLTGDFTETPFWWRAAAPVPGDAPLPERTDVLVIGSGFAGLACAAELGRAGVDVTVVDAGDLGSGASTRAAGFVSGRAGVGKQIDLVATVGPARAAAIREEADAAFEHFRQVIASDPIDCDLQMAGRFVAAHTPAAYARMARKHAAHAAEGETGEEMIPRDRQHKIIGSDAFHGGLFIRDGGMVDPAKYHAGLLRQCRAAGVRLVSGTRVLRIGPPEAERAVETSAGMVHARHVMAGTGGYTDRALPWHRRRIVPIASMMIATEDLGPERVRAVLPALCPVIDAKRVISLVRPSPDGRRILFGGRASFAPISETRSLEILHGRMARMFPQIADARIAHAWSGMMAFTFDYLPKTGEHEGIHYAMACNGGSGIVMLSWLGRKTAWRILGTANRASAFEGLPFLTRPLYAGTPWFLPAIGSWYRFLDWVEMRRAGL